MPTAGHWSAVMAEDPWYVIVNGERVGPLPRDEIASRLRAGSLDPNSVAWSPGLTTWQPLGAIDSFAPLISHPQVPASSPRTSGGLRKSVVGCLAFLVVICIAGFYLIRERPAGPTPVASSQVATTSSVHAPPAASDLVPLTRAGIGTARLRALTKIERLAVIAFADGDATALTGLTDDDLAERVASRLRRKGMTILSNDALQLEPGRPAVVVDIALAEFKDDDGNLREGRIVDGAVIVGFVFRQDITRVNNPTESPIWGRTWAEPDGILNYVGTPPRSEIATSVLRALDRYADEFAADVRAAGGVKK